MKKKLNASEMKQVCGGARASSLCGFGQKLYSCTTTLSNGYTTTGSVCATSSDSARTMVLTKYYGAGEFGATTLCF